MKWIKFVSLNKKKVNSMVNKFLSSVNYSEESEAIINRILRVFLIGHMLIVQK